MSIAIGAFGVGCTATLPHKELSTDPRQQRYAYKFVDTNVRHPVLPPPDMDNYFGQVGIVGYVNPNRPYLEDLNEYRRYLSRYIKALGDSIGITSETAVVSPPKKCPVDLSGLSIPPFPQEPDLNKITSMDQLHEAYVIYSEELYTHTLNVIEIYEETIEAFVEKCSK
jgi:hypothetical protein